MNNDIELKLSWIRLYQKLNHAGKVCDHFGISRFTLRKWLKRYAEIFIRLSKNMICLSKIYKISSNLASGKVFLFQ